MSLLVDAGRLMMGQKESSGATVTAGGLTVEQHRLIDRYLRTHKAAYIVEEGDEVRILSPDHVTRVRSMSAGPIPTLHDPGKTTYLVRWSLVISGESPQHAAASAVSLIRSPRDHYGVVEVMSTSNDGWAVYDPSGTPLS